MNWFLAGKKRQESWWGYYLFPEKALWEGENSSLTGKNIQTSAQILELRKEQQDRRLVAHHLSVVSVVVFMETNRRYYFWSDCAHAAGEEMVSFLNPTGLPFAKQRRRQGGTSQFQEVPASLLQTDSFSVGVYRSDKYSLIVIQTQNPPHPEVLW